MADIKKPLEVSQDEKVNTNSIKEKSTLKNAGFSDDEINDFQIKKNKEDIDPVIDLPAPIDTKPIQEYWESVMGKLQNYSDRRKDLKENLPQIIQNIPRDVYGEKSEFLDSIQIGIGASNFGIGAALLKGDDLPTAYRREYGEDESFLEGLVQRGTTLAFDLPFYIVGALAGKKFAPAKFKQMSVPFGAGFLAGSIRKTLLTAIEKKQISEPIEYMKIYLDEGVKAGLKEGAQLSLALNAPRLLGPKLGANYFAKVLTRFGVFEGIGAAMHGQLPNGKELAYSGIFWGLSGFDGNASKIMKAEKHYKKKADEIYIQTNKKPTEILIEENLDRTIKNDNDSINIIIPKALENLIPKTAENIDIKNKTIYHGTKELNFSDFDISKSKDGSIYFTDSLRQATNYSFDSAKSSFGRVIKRFIDENKVNLANEKQSKKFTDKQLKEKGYDGVKIIKKSTLDDKKPSTTYRFFNNEKLEKAISIQSKLEPFKSEVIRSDDPAMQHMFDNMVFGKSKDKMGIIDFLKEAPHIFEKTQVDFRAPLKRAMKEANMRVKPRMAELNVYEQALQLSRSHSLGDFFILKRTLDGKGKINGESLTDIHKNMSARDLQEYSAYELAVFHKTLTRRGLKTPFFSSFTEQIVSNKEYIKRFEDRRKRTILFRERVLNYVAEKGRLSPEQIKIIKEYNENYVPVFRELKTIEGAIEIGKGSSLKKRNKEGSELKIIDTLQSTVENTQRLIQEAEVNNLRTRFIKDVVLPAKTRKDPYFDFITKMPMKQKTTKEIREELLRDEVYSKEQLNLLSDKAINQLDAYRPNNYKQKGIFTIYLKDGTKERWNVGEDLVTATSAGLLKNFDILQRFMNPAARLTRGGALFVPGFVTANLFKDSLLAMTSVPGTWIPLVDSGIGLINIFRSKTPERFGQKGIKELYLKWESSLGPQNTLLKADVMLKDLPVHKLFNEASLKNKLLDPWETFIKGTLSLSEEATRFRIFEKVYKLGLKKGLTEEQAIKRGGFSAADLLDYSRIGTQGAYLNSLVPFWNVSAQGIRKLYVTIKDNPNKASAAIFLSIILPTIYEQILYADDPEYQKQEDFIKLNNWYARWNGVEYKIPKQFQMGTIFSSLTVSIMDYMKKDNGKGFDEFVVKFLADQVTAFNPIPQLIKPLAEIYQNKTFFTGRPVIPAYLDRSIEEPYQAVSYTSETMKTIARGINSILPDNTSIIINNPIYLDHIVRSYLATLGKHLLTLTDKLLIETGTIEDPQKMSSELSDYPLARAFVLPQVKNWSSYESMYFEELDKIKRRDATIKLLEKNNEFEEASKLKEEYPYNLAVLEEREKAYKDIRKAIITVSNAKLEVLLEADIYKTLTKIQKEEKIEALKDEKFEQVRKLRTLQILFAAEGLNMMGIKVPLPEDPYKKSSSKETILKLPQ